MKRAVLAIVLLVCGLAAAYVVFETRREATHQQLVEDGDAALGEGRTAAAVAAFSGAVALKPDSMLGYLKRGEAYRRRGDLDLSLSDLRRAAELDPTAPQPRELLGDVSSLQAHHAAAAGHYQSYLALDDRSPRVLYKLALALYRADRTSDAIGAIEAAIGLDDRSAESRYLHGLCLLDSGQRDRAMASFRQALELAPAMLQAREALAAELERSGRLDDAIAQMEALGALDPSADREVTLGLAYARGGQGDRAVARLRQAIGRYPEARASQVALGRVWLAAAAERGDRAELNKAIEALEPVVRSEPESESLTLYGRALLLASNPEMAERTLQDAASRLPVDPDAFFYLADAAERLGHFADADAAERLGHFKVARQALLDHQTIRGPDPDLRRRASIAVRIGVASMELGDYAGAVEWYGRAAGVLAGEAGFQVGFAEARWRTGDSAGARAMVDALLAVSPDHAGARALRRRMGR